MKKVMQKTQELAEAILESDFYKDMKSIESETRRDEVAASLLDDMIYKRQRVEDILSSSGMNPEELKKASAEMNEAEKAMNDNPQIQKLKEARKNFQTMMDNVNQLLRLVITGETEDGNRFRRGGSCGGSCSGCNGCG